MTAKFNGENATSNAAGAALGTLVGFKTESFLTSKYLSSQLNSFTVASIIKGNISTASTAASFKQYLEPLAPFAASLADKGTDSIVGLGFDYLGKINYINNKK